MGELCAATVAGMVKRSAVCGAGLVGAVTGAVGVRVAGDTWCCVWMSGRHCVGTRVVCVGE